MLWQSGALELGHVQALLISSLVYIDLGDSADAWTFVSRAAEILLHANSDRFSELARLPHVFRGCQLLDCILANGLHLRPHPWHEALADAAKVNEYGMEEWASSDGISHRKAYRRARCWR